MNTYHELSYVWCHQHQSLQKDPPQILPTTLPRKKTMNAWHIDTCNYLACSCNLRHKFALYMFSSCMQGSGIYMHACMHACMVIFKNAHAFELLFFIGVARLRMSSAPPGLSPSSTDSSFKHPSSTPLVSLVAVTVLSPGPTSEQEGFSEASTGCSALGEETPTGADSAGASDTTPLAKEPGVDSVSSSSSCQSLVIHDCSWVCMHACIFFLQLRFTTWARVRLWIRAFSITTCTESKHTNHGSTLYIIHL